MSSNLQWQSYGNRSKRKATAAAGATNILALTIMADPDATGEAPRSDVSVEMVQKDLIAIRTKRDTIIGGVNDYLVRDQKIDLDSKITEGTV